MTEAEFAGEVEARIRAAGLLYHWCRDSRRCAGQRGFPDLIIAGSRGLLAAELKLADGETTAGQDLWGWTIRESGHAWVLWQPADLGNGRIDSALMLLTLGRPSVPP